MSNLFQSFNSTSDSSNDDLISSQLDALYSGLNPQQVEQFYQGYSAWQMRHRLATLEANVANIDQQINDNTVLMRLVQPSAIALSTLSRLQSYGVDDINLLDTMLERGDEWLDHAMQLLTRCERMNLMHESYTEWCQHALEGAYDWLDSMNEASNETHLVALDTTYSTTISQDTASVEEPDITDTTGDETAELLLRKLMNDDETIKAPAITFTQSEPEEQIEVRDVDTHEQVQEVQQEEPATIEQITSSEEISDKQSETHGESAEDNSTQKLPGRSLVSRVLAKIWNV